MFFVLGIFQVLPKFVDALLVTKKKKKTFDVESRTFVFYDFRSILMSSALSNSVLFVLFFFPIVFTMLKRKKKGQAYLEKLEKKT